MSTYYRKAIFSICSTCAFRIDNFGFPASCMVKDACHNFIQSREYYLLDSPYGTLSYLENKGYLISTEINQDLVSVIPNLKTGKLKESNEFCWCKG